MTRVIIHNHLPARRAVRDALSSQEEQRYNELMNKFNATNVLNAREKAEMNAILKKKYSSAKDATARDVDIDTAMKIAYGIMGGSISLIAAQASIALLRDWLRSPSATPQQKSTITKAVAKVERHPS